MPAGAERAPAVVMAHGFAGTRDVALPYFAERFARVGIAAFVFDYRGFGASGGTPRQLVDPWRQLEDWRAALAFARTRADLDGSRVALLGSSLGAGHALITAADDGAAVAVVAQVPLVDTSVEGEATLYGVGWLLRLLFSGWAGMARAGLVRVREARHARQHLRKRRGRALGVHVRRLRSRAARGRAGRGVPGRGARRALAPHGKPAAVEGCRGTPPVATTPAESPRVGLRSGNSQRRGWRGEEDDSARESRASAGRAVDRSHHARCLRGPRGARLRRSARRRPAASGADLRRHLAQRLRSGSDRGHQRARGPSRACRLRRGGAAHSRGVASVGVRDITRGHRLRDSHGGPALPARRDPPRRGRAGDVPDRQSSEGHEELPHAARDRAGCRVGRGAFEPPARRDHARGVRRRVRGSARARRRAGPRRAASEVGDVARLRG
ncbi:MAG: alpha/beta fold hydrolase [Deltaproteobacteria bacterium]|nr:alpha/beta fold hydrolase [Deltaproteobacteria bacterium]